MVMVMVMARVGMCLTMRGRNMVLPTRVLISCIPPHTSVTRVLGEEVEEVQVVHCGQRGGC